MFKNKKGFTLLEILIVILIIGTLAGIGIPQYRNSVNKTKVAVHIPLMRALQDDIVNFYNLNNQLPTTLKHLALDQKEYTFSGGDTIATHKTDNCTITLSNTSTGKQIVTDCNKGWNMKYTVKRSGFGYSPDERTFNITGNNETNIAVAKNFGWKQVNSTTYTIR